MLVPELESGCLARQRGGAFRESTSDHTLLQSDVFFMSQHTQPHYFKGLLLLFGKGDTFWTYTLCASLELKQQTISCRALCQSGSSIPSRSRHTEANVVP